MDTSTPVNKLKLQFNDGKLRRNVLFSECDRSSNVPSTSANFNSSVEEADLVFSQQLDETHLNKSEELFPFSPIPFRKEVPSSLLPLLDTPDSKWTSSILTSVHPQSGNISPEVFSEDNFIQSICSDFHGRKGVHSTTNSNVNSGQPHSSDDMNNVNESKPSSFDEEISSCPSSPVVIFQRKEKKLPSVHKELFLNPEITSSRFQEQSHLLDCGAISDVTLNALEQICQDNEILYTKNSSKKSSTTNPSYVAKNECDLEQMLYVDVCKNRSKQSFIYPYDNFKKPQYPVLIDDILQSVLSLEADDVPVKVPVRSGTFRKGLVSFNELELSLNQTTENAMCSVMLSPWKTSDPKITNFRCSKSFSCISTRIPTNNRDVLTVLKRYFECHRIYFAEAIFDRRKNLRGELLFRLTECIHSKFPKQNFSASLVDLFCDFFLTNPHLVYNFNPSRHSSVTAYYTSLGKYTEYQLGLRYFNGEPSQLYGRIAVGELSVDCNESEITHLFHQRRISELDGDLVALETKQMKGSRTNLDNRSIIASSHEQIISRKCWSCNTQTLFNTTEEDATIQPGKFYFGSVSNFTSKDINLVDQQCCEKLAYQHSNQSNFEELAQEFSSAFHTARGKSILVNNKSVIRAKKLFDDVTTMQTSLSENLYPKKLRELPKFYGCSADMSFITVNEKASKNSQELFQNDPAENISNKSLGTPGSKTPFNDELDNVDLMFICDLSEKIVLRPESLSLFGLNEISEKDSGVIDTSLPCDPTKASNSLVRFNEFPVQNQISNENFRTFEPAPMIHSAIKKGVLESNGGKLINSPRKSLLQVQKVFQDNIENWNPELKTVESKLKDKSFPVESAKRYVGDGCPNSMKIPSLAEKSTFDFFSTAAGHRINVSSDSLIKSKKLLDSIKVEPEAILVACSKVDNVPSNNIGKSLTNVFCSKPKMNDCKLQDIDGDFSQLIFDVDKIICERANNELSVGKTNEISEFKIDKPLKDIVPSKDTVNNVLQISPNFSSASGKTMNVSKKALEKAQKLYDSTLEEKFANESKSIKCLANSLSRFRSSSSVCEKTNATEKCWSNIEKLHKSSFGRPLVCKSTFYKLPQQFASFSTAGGKKLLVKEDSLRNAEKLYASTLDEKCIEFSQSQLHQFPNFSSASDEKTSITEKSFLRMEKLDKCSYSESSLCNSELDKTREKLQTHHQPACFKMAGEEKLIISEESPRNAEVMFKHASEKISGGYWRQLYPSFSFASGKKISVTEKSLLRAKRLYESTLEKEFSSDPERSKNDLDLTLQVTSFDAVAENKLMMDKKSLRNVEKSCAFVSKEKSNAVKYIELEENHQQFPSFSSASGKKINVSETSLQKAEKIYKFASEETFVPKTDELVKFVDSTTRNFPSFDSASGKKISLTENLLLQTKGYESTSEKKSSRDPGCNRTDSDLTLQVVNFDAVAKKKLMVNEKSSRNTEKSCGFVSEERSSAVKCIELEDNNQQFSSFSSASGKKINVSEISLQKAEKIYKFSLEETFAPEAVELIESVDFTTQKFPSFGSASGKKVSVTENLLLKAKRLYESTSEKESLSDLKRSKTDSNFPLQFVNFNATAKNKLMVNEKSSRDAEKSCSLISKEKSSEVKSIELNENQKFSRISSASDKKINVLKTSLEKVEKIYKPTSEETFAPEHVELAESVDTPTQQFSNFGSALENKINMAEKSLKNAKSAYEFTSKEAFLCKTIVASPVLVPPQLPTSFTSVSGKKIPVTEKSLENAKKLYESVSKDEFTSIIKTSLRGDYICQPFANFASASNDEILLTDESAKFYELYQEKDFSGEFISNEVNKNPRQLSSTFSSVAGEKIKVTEENLQNAKEMLLLVSDKSMVSLPQVENFADDFQTHFPTKSAVYVRSKSIESTTHGPVINNMHLKRPYNDDTLREISSSSATAGKRMKIDTKPPKYLPTSSTMDLDSKSLFEKKVERTCLNCEGDLKSGITSPPRMIARRNENSVALSSDHDSHSHQVDCNFSVSYNANSTLKKFTPRENNIDSTFPQNDETILSSVNTSKMSNLLQCQDLVNDLELVEEFGPLVEQDFTERKTETNNTTMVNVSQEISESTSAFLCDMKNEDFFFAPVQSPLYFDSVAEKEAQTVMAQSSKSTSPVFDTSKQSRRRKTKRRSQHSFSLNPLDITYVRKDCENVAVCKTSPEDVLKMFNENFAQKANKRKEPGSGLAYPSSKKLKDSTESVDLAEQRKQAALKQQILVNEKDREFCKPRVGSILAEKMAGNRKSIRQIVKYERPQRYPVAKLLQLGLKRSVVNVSADNAHQFVFTADFLSPEFASYGDECIVISNEKNEVCFDDLARAFLASPGVDPRLVSMPWIQNHYRWIVWKLASTERSFPSIFGGKYLTLNNVLFQLKFRYDWEVDRCHRSILKRILECDSAVSDPMILCVASIKTIVASSNEYEMELTDGWYSAPCLFDAEMLKLLTQKKVTVGSKLLIVNAELCGAAEGCDPLQLNKTVRLKIATNSVRRARWYAQLGFYSGPSIRISDLQTILPNGGIVIPFSAVIARVYPILYLEKKEDGSRVLYNEKVHFKKIADFEKRRQTCLENLLSQVTSEIQDENLFLDNDEYRNTDPDSDPVVHQNRRYFEQERLQTLIQERVKQKLPEEFKTQKSASCMLKVRLINSDASSYPAPTAMLTIWHPPEDLVSLLSESKMYDFRKVVANGYRNGQVQLSANRLTKYKHLSTSDLLLHGRRVTVFTELNANFTAPFGEVDIVGLVVHVGPILSNTRNDSSHTIYLADLEKNLVAIKFRTHVKDFGFEDTLKLKNVVAGLNLQWKQGLYNGKITTVFAFELSSFVHKSRCEYLQKCIDKFDRFFKNKCKNDFVMECLEELKSIIANSGPVATSTPLQPNKHQSLTNKNSASSELLNNSSLRQNHSSDFVDNNFDAKYKNIHSRIEKLRSYGEPPPLSPISMSARLKGTKLSIQTRVHKLRINKT